MITPSVAVLIFWATTTTIFMFTTPTLTSTSTTPTATVLNVNQFAKTVKTTINTNTNSSSNSLQQISSLISSMVNNLNIGLIPIRHERSKARHTTKKEQQQQQHIFVANLNDLTKPLVGKYNTAATAITLTKPYSNRQYNNRQKAAKRGSGVRGHFNIRDKSNAITTITTTTTTSTAHIRPKTVTLVTHKMRKLHKEKISESMRQQAATINFTDMLMGGLGSHGHHRSLVKADRKQRKHFNHDDDDVDDNAGITDNYEPSKVAKHRFNIHKSAKNNNTSHQDDFTLIPNKIKKNSNNAANMLDNTLQNRIDFAHFPSSDILLNTIENDFNNNIKHSPNKPNHVPESSANQTKITLNVDEPKEKANSRWLTLDNTDTSDVLDHDHRVYSTTRSGRTFNSFSSPRYSGLKSLTFHDSVNHSLNPLHDLTNDGFAEDHSIEQVTLEETYTDITDSSVDDVDPDVDDNNDNDNDNVEFINPFLEGVVDAANSHEFYDWDEISRNNRRNLMRGRDVVTKFLQIVETQHSLGANCEAGTSLNLGEGVVDRYAQDRFRIEAEVAVNRANMLTRIFKMTSNAVQADVNLLHASVLSMVEFDDDIFAAGNCFDWNEHPSQLGLFCPFAYRLPPPDLGAILAKDLSMEYHYLGNTSEWFFQARRNAEKVIARNEQYLKAFHLYSNKSDERSEDYTLAVKYEDGRWSKPYYDCGGGNIWMLTYTVPFFGYENGSYHFKGTSGIDIDLRRVDIDQCPQRHTSGSTTQPLNIFAGTDKCKQRTTMCEALKGLGFRRGSYMCVCRKGYYFPDTTSQHKYFNGSLLEEEYEKLMLGKNSTYNIFHEYECLPCAEGCDLCEDGSPCIAALNWPMRTSILVLTSIVIGLLPPAAWFTFRYQQIKVVRAASPALLRVIALGAFFIYCTNIVMYPNPTLFTCTARIWLREIGFSLTYGALMLKTWRISVIFRVRSAKAVKITDAALLKRLSCICGGIGTCLLVRTLVSPPDVVVGRTADDLKAFLCKTDWWDYTFTSMEVVFLAWGVRLCIMVRKAPSEFNESRFISMAIYNEFLLTCFLNVSMLFLQSPANPDLLYIIFFCHTQLTITLLLCLIFGSKVYIVLRSGKSHQETFGMGPKPTGTKFNFRPKVRTLANRSSVTASTAPIQDSNSGENKLSDQEALEEIRLLSRQLQRIQEMAPPKGVAVMTISTLLDGLKTQSGMMMVAAAATQVATSTSNQLPLSEQKPEALTLLSHNNEMQKYNQLPEVLLPPSIPTTTPVITMNSKNETPPSTDRQRCDKSINTEWSGNLAEMEAISSTLPYKQHIICGRCYEVCTQHYHTVPTTVTTTPPAILSKCQQLGSPQPEGSISFRNIKIDCMCSEGDDLDALPQRRVSKRTAATNTPPSTSRSHHIYHKQSSSSASLPCDASASQATATSRRTVPSVVRYRICDNCKTKFSLSRKLTKKHKKLAHLNNKSSKLLESASGSSRSNTATTTTTTNNTLTLLKQSPRHQQQKVYSTDNIIYYTSTDDDYDDDDDDDDDVKNNFSCLPAVIGRDVQQLKQPPTSISADQLESSKVSLSGGVSSSDGPEKPRRPDKLLLNLNERSKFSKEVSV